MQRLGIVTCFIGLLILSSPVFADASPSTDPAEIENATVQPDDAELFALADDADPDQNTDAPQQASNPAGQGSIGQHAHEDSGLPIPEPGTLLLIAAGSCLMFGRPLRRLFR